jgi:thioredoxin reductase (NADPH)
MENIAIIGSGPAGYTAAIYCSRANLSPVLYTGFMQGGQLMNTTEVENYPGFKDGILGPDLMNEMEQQALRFGTRMIYQDVSVLEKQGDKFLVTSDGVTEEYKSVIFCTGASPKWLSVPGESEFLGRGVTSCATCDGFFYKGKNVVVVGAGDTAMEEALYLSKICSSVQLINRSSSYKASKIMVNKVFNTENITVHENTVIKQIIGDDKVNAVILHNDVLEKESLLSVSGVFVAIGNIPNSSLVKHFNIVESDGYISTVNTKTNIPGLFACGDVADKHYKQAITSAGSGCMAALESERYLLTQTATT